MQKISGVQPDTPDLYVLNLTLSEVQSRMASLARGRATRLDGKGVLGMSVRGVGRSISNKIGMISGEEGDEVGGQCTAGGCRSYSK